MVIFHSYVNLPEGNLMVFVDTLSWLVVSNTFFYGIIINISTKLLFMNQHWLVVWNINFTFFHIIGKNNPNWLIYCRGVGIPPTSLSWCRKSQLKQCVLDACGASRNQGTQDDTSWNVMEHPKLAIFCAFSTCKECTNSSWFAKLPGMNWWIIIKLYD